MSHPSVPGKIDKVVMEQMLSAGKTPKEVAKFFNCHPVAVYNAHQGVKRRLAIMPDLAKSELSKESLDTLSQLVGINKTVMEELGRVKRLILREDEKVKEREDLEDKVKLDPQNTALVKELKEKAHVNFASILRIQTNIIDISAEVRKQIELQIKIFETLYNATTVAQFQDEVLNAIEEADKITRDKIIIRLKQLRTLRGLVQIKR